MKTMREGEKIRWSNGGVNMIKVHCVHMWECYNETPYYVHSVYTYKKKRKEKNLTHRI
jgi:hypothetical protein